MPSEESIAAWASHNLCRQPPNQTDVKVTDDISAEHHVFENCALAIVEHYKVEGGEKDVRDIEFNGMDFTELSAQFIGNVERKLATEPVVEVLDDGLCLEYFDPSMTSCFDHDEWFVLKEGVNITCAHVANNTELCGSPEISRCANATEACALSCLPICEIMVEDANDVVSISYNITEMPTETATATPTPAPTIAKVPTKAPSEAVITAEPTPKPTPIPSYEDVEFTEAPTRFVCEDDDMWVSRLFDDTTCYDVANNATLCVDNLGFDGKTAEEACKQSCGKCDN